MLAQLLFSLFSMHFSLVHRYLFFRQLTASDVIPTSNKAGSTLASKATSGLVKSVEPADLFSMGCCGEGVEGSLGAEVVGLIVFGVAVGSGMRVGIGNA